MLLLLLLLLVKFGAAAAVAVSFAARRRIAARGVAPTVAQRNRTTLCIHGPSLHVVQCLPHATQTNIEHTMFFHLAHTLDRHETEVSMAEDKKEPKLEPRALLNNFLFVSLVTASFVALHFTPSVGVSSSSTYARCTPPTSLTFPSLVFGRKIGGVWVWRPVMSRDVAALRIQNMWRSFKGRKDLRNLGRKVWLTLALMLESTTRILRSLHTQGK